MRKGKDARLTLAFEVVNEFKAVPRMPLDQRRLVKIYYPDGINGKPLGKLPERQLFRVAERLFWNAHNLVKGLSQQEQSCLELLWRFEGSLRALGKRDWGSLDERLCIAMDSLPDDSPIAQEYHRIKGA